MRGVKGVGKAKARGALRRADVARGRALLDAEAAARARPPELRVGFADDELIVDCFAGGGGASCGIEAALGRDVDIAINHNADALKVHAANHPNTRHIISNIWEVDPVEACAGRPVGLAWFSPDCTFHSRARGGKPLERKKGSKRRALASVVVVWARTVRPRVIVLENVREFLDWGPLDANGKPIKAKKGLSFRNWFGKMTAQGYVGEWRLLTAADYGTPTTRKRLFMIFRCDGLPIVWPEASHGPGRAKPWRAAAEVIDFSRLGRSIFGREKPLAEATMRRIAAGLERYVLRGRPFIVPVRHKDTSMRCRDVADPLPTVTTAHRGELALCQPVLVGAGGPAFAGKPCGVDKPVGTVLVQPFVVPVKSWGGGGNGPRSVEEPVRTITTSKRGEFAVCQAFVVRTAHGEKNAKDDRPRWGRGHAAVDEPLGTVCASGTDFALCAPVLIQTGYGERDGQAPRCLNIGQPLGTVVGCGQKHALVAPVLVRGYGGSKGKRQGDVPPLPVTSPTSTITSRDHHWLCAAYLTSFWGTCKDGAPVTAPLGTVTGGGDKGGGHAALVRAFLVAYYSGGGQTSRVDSPLPAVVCKDRFGLVTIDGCDFEIVDIRLRMLDVDELAGAMGFKPDYDLSSAKTKEKRVALIGNAVCQQVAEALVLAQANSKREVGRWTMSEDGWQAAE